MDIHAVKTQPQNHVKLFGVKSIWTLICTPFSGLAGKQMLRQIHFGMSANVENAAVYNVFICVCSASLPVALPVRGCANPVEGHSATLVSMNAKTAKPKREIHYVNIVAAQQKHESVVSAMSQCVKIALVNVQIATSFFAKKNPLHHAKDSNYDHTNVVRSERLTHIQLKEKDGNLVRTPTTTTS